MVEYKGRITCSTGGIYTVITDTPTPAGQEFGCRARGVFRYIKETPVVGDIVMVGFERENDPTCAVITSILERKNRLIRPPVANIDYIFVTLAAASPEPDTNMADKLISIAEFNTITPVIIINKSELDPGRASELEQIYRLAGYDVFRTSCRTGEGIDALRRIIDSALPGHSAAFAGASGVGKSTLMNLLFPGLGLETSDVSAKIQRGRHTTRRVTLYPVLRPGRPSGFIADTPGFSLLDFERFDYFSKEDLPLTFREFGELLGRCRYTKCSHTKEEGCAIIAAVREGKISPSRHQNYVELYEILKNKRPWD
ncbi:MAG: ribosome small subunit-dependent GTPase A [Clostridiales bacterium]|nr:ribosome small subunit-dependent GTPase A [Clostridiales bacterium]